MSRAWIDWIGDGFHSGWIVDAGEASLGDLRLVESTKVHSGDGGGGIAGYSIVRANSYEAAVQIANRCPVLLENGSVEIRQLSGIPPGCHRSLR